MEAVQRDTWQDGRELLATPLLRKMPRQPDFRAERSATKTRTSTEGKWTVPTALALPLMHRRILLTLLGEFSLSILASLRGVGVRGWPPPLSEASL